MKQQNQIERYHTGIMNHFNFEIAILLLLSGILKEDLNHISKYHKNLNNEKKEIQIVIQSMKGNVD